MLAILYSLTSALGCGFNRSMQHGNRLLSSRKRTALSRSATEHGSTNAALCRRSTPVRLVFDQCRFGDAGVFGNQAIMSAFCSLADAVSVDFKSCPCLQSANNGQAVWKPGQKRDGPRIGSWVVALNLTQPCERKCKCRKYGSPQGYTSFFLLFIFFRVC